MHVPKGANSQEITEAVREKLRDRAGLQLLGGIPRSGLLRRLRLDEITGALGAEPVAGAHEDADLDVDVSKVRCIFPQQDCATGHEHSLEGSQTLLTDHSLDECAATEQT